MTRSRPLLLAIILFCALLITGLTPAHAQQTKNAGTTPTPEETNNYFYLATTAGAVGGLIAGALVTDGLIIPAYVWTTSSPWWSGAAGAGGAMGSGGAMAATQPASYAWSNLHYPIVTTIRWVGRVGGSLAGGLWAANWHESNGTASAGVQ
jgi:hypothetical protein